MLRSGGAADHGEVENRGGKVGPSGIGDVSEVVNYPVGVGKGQVSAV